MSGALLLEEARWRFVDGRGWTSPHEGKDGDLPDELWRDQAIALLRKRGLTVSPIGRRALSVALLQGADDPTWVECLRAMEACRAPKEGMDGAILGRRVWIEVRGDRADIEPADTSAQSAEKLRAAGFLREDVDPRGDLVSMRVLSREEAERFVAKFFPGGMENPNAKAVIDKTFGAGDDVDESWEGAWRILNTPVTALLKELAEVVRRRVEDASARAGHPVSIPGWVAREALGHVDPREVVRGVAKIAREKGWKLGLAAALLEVADHVLAPYIAAKAGLPAPAVAVVAAMPWSETIVYPLIIKHVVSAVRAAGRAAPPELARECAETQLSRLLML